MARQLVLGAGYLGAKVAELALERGHEVVLADNWYATERGELATLEARGARVETADIRDLDALARLLAAGADRVLLLAAQASRPLSEIDPDYTEETNVTGVRRAAQAVVRAGGPPVAFASSLHVYGSPTGTVGPDHPYGSQADLAHLSKIYGEGCLELYARRHGFPLGVFRLAILYGPSPVEHARAESQTVVDRFRRLAAAGEPLTLDDGGRATIGVAHVEDAARILLDAPLEGITRANVAAESLTVADVAALAERREPAGGAACTFQSPFQYRHRLADYLASPVGA
ncbi:MAG: NAD-dependent epimerase/dehydratase family protein [Gaiellaceae bacterium]